MTSLNYSSFVLFFVISAIKTILAQSSGCPYQQTHSQISTAIQFSSHWQWMPTNTSIGCNQYCATWSAFACQGYLWTGAINGDCIIFGTVQNNIWIDRLSFMNLYESVCASAAPPTHTYCEYVLQSANIVVTPGQTGKFGGILQSVASCAELCLQQYAAMSCTSFIWDTTTNNCTLFSMVAQVHAASGTATTSNLYTKSCSTSSSGGATIPAVTTTAAQATTTMATTPVATTTTTMATTPMMTTTTPTATTTTPMMTTATPTTMATTPMMTTTVAAATTTTPMMTTTTPTATTTTQMMTTTAAAATTTTPMMTTTTPIATTTTPMMTTTAAAATTTTPMMTTTTPTTMATTPMMTTTTPIATTTTPMMTTTTATPVITTTMMMTTTPIATTTVMMTTTTTPMVISTTTQALGGPTLSSMTGGGQCTYSLLTPNADTSTIASTGKFGGYFFYASSCAQLCIDDYGIPPCLAFSWDTSNAGLCWLYQYVPHVSSISTSTTNIYIKTCA